MAKQKNKNIEKKHIKNTRLDKAILFILRNKLQISLAVWYSYSWSWVLFTDTVNLAGDKKQGIVIAFIVLIFNVLISSYIMLKFFNLVRKIFSNYNLITALLISWPIFSLADFLVSWIPAFLWIGPQGRIDNVLPLSTPTLLAINTPLGFSSRIIGFYGIAGLIWLSIYLLIHKKLRILLLYPLTIFIFFSIFGWLIWKDTNGPKIQATVISEKLDERIPSINNIETNLIIFPEYGLDEIDNNNLSNRVTRQDNKEPIYFIGSAQVNRGLEVGHLNRLLFGNTNDGITEKQDKYRLIPGGEDLPYFMRTILRATNQKGTLDYFSSAKGTLKGNNQLKPLIFDKNIVVGSAVCSSIISPEDYRNFSKNGATILTNSASLSIFKGSPTFAWQQKSMAKFMAISNSRFFLQSANAASAYVIDNNGNKINETSEIKDFTEEVSNNSKNTFYTKFGELTVLIGFLIMLLILVNKIKLCKKFDNFLSKT